METPPTLVKKIIGNSASTPCRRVGLGRPSSSSLKKSIHLRTTTPIQKEFPMICEGLVKFSTASCDETIKSPLKTSDLLNKSVRRRLTTSSKSEVKRMPPEMDINNQSKKRKLSLKNVSSCWQENELVLQENSCSISTQTSSITGSHRRTQEATPEMIERLVSSIHEKQKKLDQLKVQKTYAKKHDLLDLRSLTAQWCTAGREALHYSVSLAKSAGHSVTIKQLMAQHGFPSYLMRYNDEDDDFD